MKSSQMDIDYQDFTIRRNRYISVLTALICIAVVSFIVLLNNNNKQDISNDAAAKFKGINFIETVATPSTPRPTRSPTRHPTHEPSPIPTVSPTSFPTPTPTLPPNPIPTYFPTKAPRLHPTHPPTKLPRLSPTPAPTKTPHGVPSKKPTDWSNTYHPTLTPVFVPTVPPTKKPIPLESPKPTKHPRFAPTHAPHPTPAPSVYSCVNSFTDSVPGSALTLYLENPTQTVSYTTVHGQFIPGDKYSLPVYCLNYFKPIQTYFIYNSTFVTSIQAIQANPSAHGTIEDGNLAKLNQVTWILNNFNVGDSAFGQTPSLDGYTFSNCSTITSSDIQSAFWYLMNYPKCVLKPFSFNCDESTYIDQEGTSGFCNTAYIITSALAGLPLGETFTFPPGSVDETTTVVPILFLPDDDQPLIVSASLSQWDYKCT